MPLYDYRCEPCDVVFEAMARIAERHNVTCGKCGTLATLVLLPGRSPSVHTFQPGWWGDIAAEPIYCETPQELKDACDKYNARSEYLENGIWKTNSGEERKLEDRTEGRPWEGADNLLRGRDGGSGRGERREDL